MDFLKRFKKQNDRDTTSGQESPAETPAPPPTPVREPLTVREVNPSEVYEQLQAGEVILLDVRQSWDHESQHPAGSLSLPLNELADRLEELDPNQHYVLSCYHGFSSQDGVAFLMNQGFENVESMRGGFSGWAQSALPIEGRYAS
jgi:thiosulfate sulfurtransferase